jgi:hypothetical protein
VPRRAGGNIVVVVVIRQSMPEQLIECFHQHGPSIDLVLGLRLEQIDMLIPQPQYSSGSISPGLAMAVLTP